ncbi:MAG: SH3 domain-containing protein [Candidatus Acidiferrales bacterium]
MTALSVALVLIFVLYLIDKHSLWRKAAKISIYSVAALVVVGASTYGWFWHKEKQQEAENAVYKAKMKPIWDCEARNAQFSNAEEECEKTPSVVLQPITITPTPIKRSKPFGDARIIPDTTVLFGCNSPTLITTLSNGTRVKVLSERALGQVQIQISDGRIGCLLEKDEVQRDKP